MEAQRSWIVKTIVNKKNNAGRTTISALKIYYRTIIIKSIWYWHKTDIWTNGIKLKTQT